MNSLLNVNLYFEQVQKISKLINKKNNIKFIKYK
jgi:hypothetical protein